MSRVRVLSGLSAAVAIGLTACSDFTSSGDPLSEGEATELAEVLVGQGFAGFSGFGAAAPMGAPANTDAKVTISIDDSGPCEGGGTVALAGSMTVEANDAGTSGTLTFNYTVAPAGCEVTTTGGQVFTLTGDPNIKATGDFTFSGTDTGGAFEGSLNYDGKFAWESSDGRSGACGVNLKAEYNFSFSGTGSSGSATLTGSVCGVTVNRTISVEA